MAALFGRRCRLLISAPTILRTARTAAAGTETVEIIGGDGGMRIQASIKKSLKKEPNTSEIRITNLSPSRRAELQTKGVRVHFEAGYKDTGMFGLFNGDVRTIDHIREGANWTTVMQVGDGERSWQFARVKESFSPGTPKSDVMKTLGGAMGLDLGNLAKMAGNITGAFDQGYSASGSASRAFDGLMKGLKLDWSVQDGAIQVLEKDGVLDGEILEIGSASGLIGSPEMGTPPKSRKKPHYLNFQFLLAPVKCGGKVRLKSERYDGDVRVLKADYELDTHGGPWYTKVGAQVLK